MTSYDDNISRRERDSVATLKQRCLTFQSTLKDKSPFFIFYDQRVGEMCDSGPTRRNFDAVDHLKSCLPLTHLDEFQLKRLWFFFRQFGGIDGCTVTKDYFGDVDPWICKTFLSDDTTFLTIQQRVVLLSAKLMRLGTQEASALHSQMQDMKDLFEKLSHKSDTSGEYAKEQALFGIYATLKWFYAMLDFGGWYLGKHDQFRGDTVYPLVDDLLPVLDDIWDECDRDQRLHRKDSRKLLHVISTVASVLRGLNMEQSLLHGEEPRSIWRLVFGNLQQPFSFLPDVDSGANHCMIEDVIPWIAPRETWGTRKVKMDTEPSFGVPTRGFASDGTPIESPKFIEKCMGEKAASGVTLNLWTAYNLWGILHPALLDWLKEYRKRNHIPRGEFDTILKTLLLAFQHTSIGCYATSSDPLEGAREALERLATGHVIDVEPPMKERFWPMDIEKEALAMRKDIAELLPSVLKAAKESTPCY